MSGSLGGHRGVVVQRCCCERADVFYLMTSSAVLRHRISLSFGNVTAETLVIPSDASADIVACVI